MRWGTSSANASGRLYYRSCWGSCYNPKYLTTGVSLSDVQSHAGVRYFDRLAFWFWYRGHEHVVMAYYNGVSSRYGYWAHNAQIP